MQATQSENDLNIISKSLLVICFLLCTQALIYAKSILIPFVFAIFIYACLRTVALYLQRKIRMRPALALSIVTGLGIVSLMGFASLIVNSVTDFAQSTGEYSEKLTTLAAWINTIIDPYGFVINESTLKETLLSLPFMQYAKELTGNLTQILADLTLISIFVLFLLIGDTSSQKKKIRPQTHSDDSVPLIDALFSKISIYVGAKLLLSLLTGGLVAIVYFALGLDLAILFVMLTVLLNFIPNIGSLIAVALPLPVALVQFGFGWQFVVLLVATTLIQMVIGNLLEPSILGKNLELHPVVVLFALVFWGLLWGVSGMFLAVPVTAILKVVLGLFNSTRALAQLFEGDLSILNSKRIS